MAINEAQLTQEIFDRIKGDVQGALSEIGETGGHISGYLGRGDGTTTIINPERTATREVFAYLVQGGQKMRYFSAILGDCMGAMYQDSALLTDLPVVLSSRPGSDVMTVVGINGREYYRNTSGLTPLEQMLPVAKGAATLVAGTVTVTTPYVTSNNLIFLTPQETGNITGVLRVSARTAGTSFTILSSVNTDTAVIAWLIMNA